MHYSTLRKLHSLLSTSMMVRFELSSINLSQSLINYRTRSFRRALASCCDTEEVENTTNLCSNSSILGLIFSLRSLTRSFPF